MPDMHSVNIVLKVAKIEQLIVNDPQQIMLVDTQNVDLPTSERQIQQGSNISQQMNLNKQRAQIFQVLLDNQKQQKSNSYGKTMSLLNQSSASKARDIQTALKVFMKSIMISLIAFDETASIRVLIYSQKFLDLPIELIESMNLNQSVARSGQKPVVLVSSEDAHQIKNTARLVHKLKTCSVLSCQNVATELVQEQQIVQFGHLTLLINLDSKYGRTVVYNKDSEDEDERLAADFLNHLSDEELERLSGQGELGSGNMVSNYELMSRII